MAVASIDTRAILGMDSPKVTVEVHVSNGLPLLSIVGLPEASVKESKDRVRSALQSSGFQMPPKRITVNLAPADLPKSGGRYDLPIALAILVATEQLDSAVLSQFEAYAELALTGETRHISGVISSVLATVSQGKNALLSVSNRAEIELLVQTKPEIASHLFLVQDLRQACQVLMGQDVGGVDISTQTQAASEIHYDSDLADVIGQNQAKRVLEVAASGDHSMLMVGPPGSGKSMLASRLVTILPQLSSDEAIEVAKIRSIIGHQTDHQQFYARPFIQPHHTASAASIVGGGTNPKPGALSLAHAGVLFLDELPEFNKAVLEALREPLETKQVNISRVNQHVTYPANNLLVAAMNPSPSGFFPDDPLGRCKDTPEQIFRYQKKISGPLMDRIDLHLEVPAVDINDLRKKQSGQEESSQQVRARVSKVRSLQLERQGCFNAMLKGKALETHCVLDDACDQFLDKAVTNLGLSARGYHRVLRVARTIADMEGSTALSANHLAEALSYRSLQKALL